MLDCTECNEALGAARQMAAVTLRLALLADNAIMNGDLHRARTALGDLLATAGAPTSAGPGHSFGRGSADQR